MAPQLLRNLYHTVTDKAAYLKGVYDIRKHKFWFIDIPRTSSSSIKVELSHQFGPSYGKTNLLEKKFAQKSAFKDHRTAQEMQQVLGRALWDEIFKFTLVRNPWDRMVSLYAYRRKKGTIPPDLSFRDLVLQFNSPRYMLAHALHARHSYYYPQVDFLQDAQGKMMVDFVGRYENREEDLKVIAERLGCPGLGRLLLQSAKPTKHYATFYDEETREIIRRVYAQDIALFGYEFEA
ncbi:Sulfotransferase family protein [Catalinimonas alkaloidigena]|uniref:Sulfotransferase family protein n=1 Tax=Catalinimonas alkaloidigena TaxID=1075417 RepID=A0A1G9RNU6_9BACT|nr:sulfotransferase family 2 domain-containing protein [Catalinimonas alkaloidigena]SDM24968.1 Sulfotransferase family protein [Catalinimonas alkaloidigena]